jgi:SAM-dependent methyltransferase
VLRHWVRPLVVELHVQKWVPYKLRVRQWLLPQPAALPAPPRHPGRRSRASPTSPASAASTGPCLEIGSGTGVLTGLLLDLWQAVVCVDLSWGMLARASSGWRVQADAARLPVADAAAAAVLIGDAPLFAAQTVRVLSADGVVVWVNALGRQAPFHVPTPLLLEALTSASGGSWEAVQSEAYWGSWAVLRRTQQAAPGHAAGDGTRSG